MHHDLYPSLNLTIIRIVKFVWLWYTARKRREINKTPIQCNSLDNAGKQGTKSRRKWRVANLRVKGPGKAWEEPQRNHSKLYHLSLGPNAPKKLARERKISIRCNPRKKTKKHQKQEYKMPVRDWQWRTNRWKERQSHVTECLCIYIQLVQNHGLGWEWDLAVDFKLVIIDHVTINSCHHLKKGAVTAPKARSSLNILILLR